jgi:hypothetical protein
MFSVGVAVELPPQLRSPDLDAAGISVFAIF